MKLQLFSIDHAPSQLPIWQLMMDNLCNPPPERVARVLGISVRSVYRYNATGYAPRPVCLAVFWLTQWGRSAVNAQAINDAMVAVGYLGSLQTRVRDLETTIAQLVQLGDFGSANDPGSAALQRSRRPHDLLR